ncbi:hypothetical protein [Streptomyces zaomyceticus]|uniref:hypothetical protein n=1 Tax=Streptomyces zaomyceticus TaxID=68286 RepID=UPI0016745B79|nr:hypothetical protein [Streptomyces zaomyceticus]GHG06291.1 hypothetical protein GCM10018791_18410 [Streptomyces zaomyceticus]
MNRNTTHPVTQDERRGRRIRARRLGSTTAALLLALGSTAALTGEASARATACATFGCDGHNPNIQTWQRGPSDALGEPHPFGGIDLRAGTTDGDQYAWARATYMTGSGGGHVYVNRRNRGGGGEEFGRGPRALGQEGWTTSVGTNTIATWSGMYYNPTYKQVQACVYLDAQGRSYCTGWY